MSDDTSTSDDTAVSEETAPPAAPAPVKAPPAPSKSGKTYSEAEKAIRKDRVAKAKDALARSVGMKGDHVTAARASLKTYLQRLNEPKQPDDGQFEALIAAPFAVPYKKKQDRRF